MTCFIIEYTNDANITQPLIVEFVNNRRGDSFVNFYSTKIFNKATKFDSFATANRVLEVLANFGPNYIPKDNNTFYKKLRIVECEDAQANFDANDRNLAGCERYCENLYKQWKARIEQLDKEIAELERLQQQNN